LNAAFPSLHYSRGEIIFPKSNSENELGGRVVVMGYAPWIFLHSVGKRLQLQNVADWLSRDTMPLRVDETVPLLSVVRLSADRQWGAVLLLNAGMDEILEATVHLRVAARRGRQLTIGQLEREVELKPESSGGCLTVRDIPPWGFRMLLWDDTPNGRKAEGWIWLN
jgi:hypothetical protein